MSTPSKRVLGRGMSSLIRKTAQVSDQQKTETKDQKPDADQSANAPYQNVALARLSVNPHNPRRHFNAEALAELADSIKQAGIIQPLLVKPLANGFEIIAGERRFRAAKLAGLKEVPVVVQAINEATQFEWALIENLQREDLSPMEEARGYQRLATEFSLSQEAIAQKVGKQRSTVANMMRLLKLSPLVAKLVDEGKLSMGHARALVSVEPARRQENLALEVTQSGMSVRQLEKHIGKQDRVPAGSTQAPKAAGHDVHVQDVQNRLRQKLGTKIAIHPKGKGGDIRLAFFNAEDFRRLTDLLLK